ncbi:MAG: MGMT family protein [Treponema sp.]|jgi:methylated-DNA-protein-cysteine methyltransferase-like protein|nr:MGMT family protein [Treponema sp.]
MLSRFPQKTTHKTEIPVNLNVRKMTDTTQKIIEQILAIPKGRVSSYRDIALKAGIRNGARQTVRVLHTMSKKYNLPWHRVIRSNGDIALKGEGREQQIALLKNEGVDVSPNGRVNMAIFGNLY